MTDAELISLLKARYGSAKKTNGNWVNIPCPTCTPRDARKCRRGVNLDSMVSSCFICGVKMPVRDLLGSTEFERVEGLAEVEKVEHPQARIMPCDQLIPLDALPEDHPAVQLFLKDHLKDLNRYWSENQIGYIAPDAAQNLIWEEKGTSMSTADSLLFPVHYKSELVGWQLRFLSKPKLRYMHLFNKGNYLYNYDNAINYEIVVVCEGVKKALKFPSGVATFGKQITPKQIQKLMNWKKIIFLYDGEDDTQAKTQELVNKINIGGRQCINIDPRDHGYPSPDEMPEDVALKIVFDEWRKQTKDGSK